MNLQAVLQNAYGISYEKRMNELWTASFNIPADDPKIIECLPFRFAEFFDGDERVELFRILPNKYRKDSAGKIITFQCEHVLGTLIDDILFQYHQTTNLSPANTLQYILNQQTAERWEIDTVNFTDLYSYKWENENLLSAILSVPKAYSDEYMFTFDTTVYPWKLNLVTPSTEVTAHIRYGKNLQGIEKDEDPTYIVTRIYPLGYGEGDNQLTIKSVNGGVPYLDADTIGTYGIIASPFIDKSEENAATLKAKALASLERIKMPRVTYSIDGADIYQITEDTIDRFRDPGTLIKVFDEDLGIITSRIITVRKPDLDGKPGDIQVEISNKVLDITDITTSLQKRQRISEVYAQGATNLYAYSYYDNCDKDHPAIIRVFIPNETVRINMCLLSNKTEYFRAYEKGMGVFNFGDIETQTSDASQWILLPAAPLLGDFMGKALNGTIYEHRHAMESVSHYHNVTLPEHQHQIEYGIFEFEHLPSDIIVKVDGNVVSGTNLNENNLDITDYLESTDGKINRGAFHRIEITPVEDEVNNPNGLARIEANLIVQCFIQSRGGGDY
jgi:phage minor structural protein